MSTLFHSIVSLLRRRGFNVEVPEQTVAPTPPPPPPPELSCFVKGLIHSMKTEPEKWTLSYRWWTHNGTGIKVHFDERVIPKQASVVGSREELSFDEAWRLAEAVETNLIPYLDAAIAEFQKPKVAYFEKLGCQDRSS